MNIPLHAMGGDPVPEHLGYSSTAASPPAMGQPKEEMYFETQGGPNLESVPDRKERKKGAWKKPEVGAMCFSAVFVWHSLYF
jgi:hypothetical protein